MGFKRFLAPTARLAMEAVRRELGDEAVILSNRRLGDQIEILAAASHAVDAIVEGEIELGAPTRSAPPAARPAPAPVAPRPVRAAAPARAMTPPAPAPTTIAPPAPARGLAAGREGAAMYASVAASPEGDEEDVRRWSPPEWKGASLRFGPPNGRPQARRGLGGDVGAPPAARPAAAPIAPVVPASAPVPVAAQRRAAPASAPAAPPPTTLQRIAPPAVSAPAEETPPAVFRRRPSRLVAADAKTEAVDLPPATIEIEAAPPPAPAAAAPAASPSAITDPRVLAELQSMRDAFSAQIAALGSSLVSTLSAARMPVPMVSASAVDGSAAAAPVAPATSSVHVLMRLLTSGFSASLARYISQRAPQVADLGEVDAWLQQVLTANIKCVDPAADLVDAGGAYALIGPTGVGKTTTLAKIAARFAVRHGAGRLGLITLDSYRIGAHEQLRTYGRILGTPVQVAHDAATLRETLAAMKGRDLVLIDTCGISQRDERVQETLSILRQGGSAERPIKRLLLLNAALHVETLDDVAQAWCAGEAAGAILTKLDEAARCGAVLDCVIRHRLPVMGLTNGQRVPEDWHAARAALLAHVALKPAGGRFTLGATEAPAFASRRAAARADA